MALTVGQVAAVSYPDVLTSMRGAHNQWVANPALKEFESQGFMERASFGENIEVPMDYRSNPDTAVLVADQDTAALVNTEVMTSAVYDIAQMNVPVIWTRAEEAKNPTDTQKINLTRQKLENGINSHDDLLEQRIFTSSTAGGVEINGLNDLIANAGTGTVGGIDSSVETWHQNKTDTFTDASDIEAAMTEMFNSCAKGTGESIVPTLLISGSATHALFEGQLQSLIRYNSREEANHGFKALAFKDARYIFSHRGGTSMYFLNPRSYQLRVSKQYFRHKDETDRIQGQNASYFLIYSALQFVVMNRSRLGVLRQS